MGYNQITKQPLENFIQIKSKYQNQQFKYYSDIVYKTQQYNIPIEKIVEENNEYIYFLDMKQFCQNNQRILNNFSVIQSEKESIICLLVFEQNQYSIVFP